MTIRFPRLPRLAVLFALFATPGMLFAQYNISGTSPNSFLSNATIPQTLVVSGTLPTSGYNYCFYTGYGASATPIVASPQSATSATLSIPASSINSIPSTAFTAGSYLADVNIIPASQSTCTASSTSSNTANVVIAYSPGGGGGTGGSGGSGGSGGGSLGITNISPSQLMQSNPALSQAAIPHSILITGSGFQAPTTVSYSWGSGSASGTILYESTSTLQVSVPTIPAGVTSVSVTVCEGGTTCVTSSSLSVVPLATTTGVISAAPNPSTVGVSTTLSATITGSSTIGAPSGVASVSVNGGPSTPAKLTLDPVTATFATGGTATLTSPPLLNPITGDVNGDGIPDLAYADQVGALHILLGTTPTGSYQTDTTVSNVSGCYYVNSMVLADFNGDGLADIAMDCADVNNVNHVYVALSNGDGSFQNATQLSNPVGTVLLTGDMNHDGKLDIVLVSANGGTNGTGLFSVYTGNGDGTFAASTVTAFPASGDTAPNYYAADIDGDGYPDLVATSITPGATTASIDIYRNQNNTVYGVAGGASGNTPTYSIPLLVSQYSYGNLLMGDVNGDGLPDLVLGYNLLSTASTFGVTSFVNGSKPGTILFTPGPYSPLGAGPIIGMYAGDFNGDGLTDVLAGVPCSTNCSTSFSGLNVSVLIGDGTGNFTTSAPNLQLTGGTVGAFFPAPVAGSSLTGVLAYPAGEAIPTFTSYIPTGKTNITLPYTPTTDGANAITLSYPGDLNFTGTTLSLSLPVAGAPVTVGVGSSLLTSQYGQPVILTATVSSAYAGSPSGTVSFYDGPVLVGQAPVVGGAATLTVSTLTAGIHGISASYAGNTAYAAGVSNGSVPLSVTQATPTITWTPVPITLTYGTALTTAQLNAVASSKFATTIPGTYQYSIAAGQVLTAGSHTVQVTFTPTDTVDFAKATGSAVLTVTQATPTITWPAPAPVVLGTTLSATQLDATATGPLGAVPGQFTYSQGLGTILTVGGTQNLTVSFVPTDTVDYAKASGSTTLTVIPLALTQVTPGNLTLGAGATTLTLTGTGFIPGTVVKVNNTAVPTVYVSPTGLTATVPSTLLQTVQVLHVEAVNQLPQFTSNSNTLTAQIVAPAPAASFNGPTTVQPAQQPTLSFTLTSGYPVPITGTLTLTFAGTGGVDDPAIQFATGGRTQTFTIPANSTVTPTIQIQSGTVAGTITVTLTLTAGGQDVTPSSITPVNITVPPTSPGITQATATLSGNVLTVSVTGFSNSRDMSSANFQFIPKPGVSLSSQNSGTLTVPVNTVFHNWFGGSSSLQYGSEFTYTQTFNLNNAPGCPPPYAPGSVGCYFQAITVTLSNSVGTSSSTSAQ